MPDISREIAQIEVASRGEDVRDAIISALNAINGDSAWNSDDTPTEGSTHPITSGGVYTALAAKEDKLHFDSTPTQNSRNPVTSGGVFEALQDVQESLVFDEAPTPGSANPVTSRGIYSALQNAQNIIDFDDAPTQGSGNPVTSDGIFQALVEKQDTLQFDETPTVNSEKPVKSGGVYAAMRNIQTKVAKATVVLGTAWIGNGPYKQTVTVEGATIYSKIDIQPDAAVLRRLLAEGVKALWIENDDGVLTARAIGAAPSTELTLQCTLQETGDGILYDNEPTEGSPRLVTSGGVYAALSRIDVGSVDPAPAQGSANAVSSGGVYTALAAKQDRLTFDTAPTAGSGNPVTSGGVNTALAVKQDRLTFDTAPTAGSSNPVTSGGVNTALSGKEASANKVTAVTAASTDTEYPSAKAVWALFHSIADGNSVSY